MTTAQILFEQYKVLPRHVQQQYKKLIDKAEKTAKSPMPAKSPAAEADDEEDETGDTIRISLEALHSSIEQVKLLKADKAELSTLEALFAELVADE